MSLFFHRTSQSIRNEKENKYLKRYFIVYNKFFWITYSANSISIYKLPDDPLNKK